MILAPVVRGRKGEYKKDLEKLARQGFLRARIDGKLHALEEPIKLDKRKNHTIEVVVDRLLVKPGIEKRLEASIETATKLANGLVLVAVVNGEERLYSQKLACPDCGTERAATGAPLVLLQQPLRRLRDLRRAGRCCRVRPLLDGLRRPGHPPVRWTHPSTCPGPVLTASACAPDADLTRRASMGTCPMPGESSACRRQASSRFTACRCPLRRRAPGSSTSASGRSPGASPKRSATASSSSAPSAWIT